MRMDPSSDIITARLSGLCQNCMVLKASSEVVSEQDVRLGLGDGLYGHHVMITDIGGQSRFPPLRMDPKCEDEMNNSDSGFGLNGQGVLNLGTGMGGGMSDMDHKDSHGAAKQTKAAPSVLSSAMTSIQRYLFKSMAEGGIIGNLLQRLLPDVAIMIGEGGESTPSMFAGRDKNIKSGFWVGEDHRLNAMAEVINYNTQDKEVYLSIDYEYLPNVGTERPSDYREVAFGVLAVGCGKLDLHPDKTSTLR